MGFAGWLFDELKVANSCYMSAAIEFNYAMFHIFSGPLFANLEGYVFLDLLIWGISPLIFELFRESLKAHIQPITAKSKKTIINRRFGWFIGCFFAICISYLFMNYSPKFRWNYFSRIINLDFGFLLFDLAGRCMELLVEVEEEEQHRVLIDQQSSTIQPILHNGGYCKYRNIFMMASYFLVFYFSIIHDPSSVELEESVFGTLSLLCCVFTLTIPTLYIFRHRYQSYGALSQRDEMSEQEINQQIQEQVSNKNRIIFLLIAFSYFVNMSYFSLWIMEGFNRQKDDELQQFNKTLFVSSAFFLASSFIQFFVSNTYIGCKMRSGMLGQDNNLSKLIRPFLIAYGILILTMFISSRSMEWHYMVPPILFFGIHNILMEHLGQKIEREGKSKIGYHKLIFYCEVDAEI